jgi:threonine aldolase
MHNFASDTQTLPSRAMREAVLDAPLADEQGAAGDPTTNALCERVADMLGKEAAVFMPSGTMCNQIAIAVHCRPGDEVICHESCHIIHNEAGGAGALSGVSPHALTGPHGRFAADQLLAAIRHPSRYSPVSRMIAVEQTANYGGGAVWPVAELQAVAEAGRAAGLATHMDGARLMNAVVASGRPAHEHAKGYDSVWLDFSKGLGCPVGAVMAGSKDFIHDAWRVKQRFGGAMRQSGVLAAMCLYALDHNVDRLAEDHALTASIASRIGQMAGIASILPVDTNIVIFDLDDAGPDAETVAAGLAEDGVAVSLLGPRKMRVVTHLDVDAAGGDALCAALARRLAG